MRYFCLLLLLSAGQAFGFESFPEFETLTETEQEDFERPRRLGSEYQSDILTYAKLPRWHYLWLSNARAIDLSAGSTSPVDFGIDNRLKVHHELTDTFEFRFTYFAERNHERDSTHAIIEMLGWLNPKVGLSIYAEPSLHKRENDVGLAVLLRPSGSRRHELRIFNTWVDITRTKRNDRTDVFDKAHTPKSRGFVGRLWNNRGDFLEYSLRQETETQWLFPTESYRYQYWAWAGALHGSHAASETLRLNARAQIDRKFEARTGSQSEAWRNDRVQVTTSAELAGVGPARSWTVQPGLAFAWRRWNSGAQELRTRDLLPHAWLFVPAFRSVSQVPDTFGAGYEFTWHLPMGNRSLDPLHQDDTAGQLEHRMNLSYELAFSPAAAFRLLATFDLDKLGTSDTWEGGGAQFRLAF